MGASEKAKNRGPRRLRKKKAEVYLPSLLLSDRSPCAFGSCTTTVTILGVMYKQMEHMSFSTCHMYTRYRQALARLTIRCASSNENRI